MFKCKSEVIDWRSVKSGKNVGDAISKMYLPSDKYDKYFVFISSNKYDKCSNCLDKLPCVVKYHELYGKYDFLVKAYLELNSPNEHIERMKDSLFRCGAISSKKNIERDVVFVKVENQFSYFNRELTGQEINSDCVELDEDRFNMISAFVEIAFSKRKSKEHNIDLMQSIFRTFNSDIANELVSKVYYLNNGSALWALNINCQNIRNLINLTTFIDAKIDSHRGVTKTTFISPRSKIIGSHIDSLFPPKKSADRALPIHTGDDL